MVKALLESGKYRVRGVTRNPDSDRAQTLKDAGVELVKAEQHNCEEMKSALEGAYAAYVVRGLLNSRAAFLAAFLPSHGPHRRGMVQ